MDCNCNQRSSCTCRPQMPATPCMNTNCGCGQTDIQPRQIRPQPPIMPMPAAPALNPNVSPAFSACVREDRLSGMPIAMGYVPWQKWKQTYSLEQGLNRGTIFPELDLPFVMGRCR